MFYKGKLLCIEDVQFGKEKCFTVGEEYGIVDKMLDTGWSYVLINDFGNLYYIPAEGKFFEEHFKKI